MIVWRNSRKEITDADLERCARQCATDRHLEYVHHVRQLNEKHVLLLVTCERGIQLRTEVLCEYLQGPA